MTVFLRICAVLGMLVATTAASAADWGIRNPRPGQRVVKTQNVAGSGSSPTSNVQVKMWFGSSRNIANFKDVTSSREGEWAGVVPRNSPNGWTVGPATFEIHRGTAKMKSVDVTVLAR